MALKRLPHQRPILRILMSPLPQNDLYETGYSITSVRSRDLKNSMKTRTTSTILGKQEELDAGMWRVTITALLGHMTWKIVKHHIGQLNDHQVWTARRPRAFKLKLISRCGSLHCFVTRRHDFRKSQYLQANNGEANSVQTWKAVSPWRADLLATILVNI